MFILKKINKDREYNIELGEIYIYVSKDNILEFEHIYSECFKCKFGEFTIPSDISGFVIVDMKPGEKQDSYYPIYIDSESYIMTSEGKTYCRLN